MTTLRKFVAGGLTGLAALGLSGVMAAPSLAATKGPALEIGWGVYSSYTRNFNPFSTSDMGITNEMYEPLFYFDNVANRVEPLLGTSYAWSNHNTVLTVHLRKNVHWSNGSPFTAKDVVFTFDMLKKYPAMDRNGVWTKLSSVTETGKYGVAFTFKAADIPFDFYILGQTPIVPQVVWGKLKGNPLDFLNPNPVISGPYVLNTFNSQDVTLVPNNHYWGGVPKVPELNVPLFTSNTAQEPAMASGKIGWGAYYESSIQKLYVDASPKYNHYWLPPSSPNAVYPNLTNPLLKQLVVREAISEAINRTKLDKLAESGYDPPSTPTLLSAKNADQKPWIDSKLPLNDRKYTYNPKAAVRLLEKAGFKKNGSGMFVSRSGAPLSFTLDVVSGLTDAIAECSIIENELKAVGIHITVNQVTGSEFTADELDGSFQLAFGTGMTTGPTIYTMYHSAFGPVLTEGNYERWHNPTMYKLLREFRSTNNIAKEHQLADRMESLVAKNLPIIGTVETPYWYEWSNKDYVGWPTPSNPYAAGSSYMYPAPAVILSHLRPR